MNKCKRLFTVSFFLALCFTARAEESFLYDSHGKRDPFEPLVGKSEIKGKPKIINSLLDITSIDEVKLQGIASDTHGKKVVIINNEMIRVGETIGHLTVERISANRVILRIDNGRHELNIYEEQQK